MNTSISLRLAVMSMGAVLALLIVGLLGYTTTQKVADDLQFTSENVVRSLGLLSDAQSNFLLIRVNGLYHLSYDEPARKTPHEKAAAQAIDGIRKSFSEYEKLIVDQRDQALLDEDRKLLSSYLDALERMLGRSRANDRAGAHQVIENEWKPAGEKLTAAFAAHKQYNEKLASDLSRTTGATAQRNSVMITAATLAGAILLGVMSFLLSQGIRTSLREMRDAMLRVEAALDFTARARALRRDEIGETATAFNRLLEKLQENMRHILARANEVSTAANEMAVVSRQVARASEQQSEAASSMAASVEQMSVSINHVGDSANEANQCSNESGQLAADGEKLIGRTMVEVKAASVSATQAEHRIRALERESESISSVVAVIKEVADQTNLLALNAAIEAARAGEQGRGFAVVADEVRKLAERTAVSTGEITATIESMRQEAQRAVDSMQQVVQQIERSAQLSDEANQTMIKVGAGSQKAVSMVGEISSAMREQTQTSHSIALQIENVAQMSEEGSAAAKESAHSATVLQELSSDLKNVVSAYRI